MSVVVVGFDPGIAKCGIAVVELFRGHGERVLHLDVFTTVKSDRKHRVLASDDTIRRFQELHRAIGVLIGPRGRYDVSAVAMEAFSAPRSASAAAKVSGVIGVIVGFAEAMECPLVSVPPKMVKSATVGRMSASKSSIEAAMTTKFRADAVKVFLTFYERVPMGDRNHAMDALAVVSSVATGDVFRALRGGGDVRRPSSESGSCFVCTRAVR